jgi:lipoprotein signal peptidase
MRVLQAIGKWLGLTMGVWNGGVAFGAHPNRTVLTIFTLMSAFCFYIALCMHDQVNHRPILHRSR